jgi:hypothetical protein
VYWDGIWLPLDLRKVGYIEGDGIVAQLYDADGRIVDNLSKGFAKDLDREVAKRKAE